jgi:hypothetical protein
MMTDIASYAIVGVTAVGVLLTGLSAFRNGRKADTIHDQLKTTNNHTVGELIEQNLPPSYGDQVASDNPRGEQTQPSRSTKTIPAGELAHRETQKDGHGPGDTGQESYNPTKQERTE